MTSEEKIIMQGEISVKKLNLNKINLKIKSLRRKARQLKRGIKWREEYINSNK